MQHLLVGCFAVRKQTALTLEFDTYFMYGFDACYDRGSTFRLERFVDGGAPCRKIVGKKVAFLPDCRDVPRLWFFLSDITCSFLQNRFWERSYAPNFVGPQKASGAPLS